MKSFLIGLLGMAAVACGQEHAWRYEVGTLAPNQQNLPVDVEASGSVAMILQPVPGGRKAVVYRRDGTGTWAEEDELSTGTAITAAALNASQEMAAIGVGNVVEIHRPSFPPDWQYFGSAGSIVLPVDEEAVRISIDGNYAAVQTNGSGAGILDPVVRVYEFAGGAWTEVNHFRFTPPPETFGGAGVSGLCLRGTRLVAASQAADEVQVRERTAAGGPWETVATIDVTALGLKNPGAVALAGDRLAVVAEAATGGVLQVEAFSRNTGGTDAWGHAGTVRAGTANDAYLTLDADGPNLVVMSLPRPELLVFHEVATADFYGPGAGATGWAHEATRDLGHVNGSPSLLTVRSGLKFVAVAGDDALFGLADEAYAGGGASWAATVFRRAASWAQVQRIDGPGAPAGLGKSISMSGGIIAVGMPDDAWMGAQTGAVMLWGLAVTGEDSGQILIPLGRVVSPAPQAGARFGESVAVHTGEDSLFSGMVLVVGEPGRDGGKGAAYWFGGLLGEVGPGTALAHGETLAAGDEFGASVAVTGNPLGSSEGATTMAVGMPGDDDAGADAGAVIVFGRDTGSPTTWSRLTKRVRPATIPGAAFGSGVAFFGPGDTLLGVSQPPIGGASGRVAVLGRNEGGSDAWGVQQTLTPPAGSPPGFGRSVAGDLLTLAVGATGNTGGTGKAYLYAYNALAGDPFSTVSGTSTEGPSFGSSVAVSNLNLCVGSPKAASGAGRISTWGQLGPTLGVLDLLYHQTGTAGEALGTAVGSYFIYSAGGAPGADFSGTNHGGVVLNRAGSYEVWAKSRGTALMPQWLPQQDADGDGQANLIEFALGSDPLSGSSLGPFTMVPGTYSGLSMEPSMMWTVPAPGYSQRYLDFRMQRSEALGSWQTADWSSAAGVRHFLRQGRPRQFYRLSPLYPWFGRPSGDTGIIVTPL
ncbi:hypothetical protein [Haloferula sargassicola]|uniref:FG-GAP repeat protein n=1 Tax=Haloferula sargassicola TaxID=490096 RepID=A0ABP9UIE7_9BACT